MEWIRVDEEPRNWIGLAVFCLECAPLLSRQKRESHEMEIVQLATEYIETKLCLENLLGLLAFTSIAALALITSGIALISFPSELSGTEVIIQNYTIEYTHCKPVSQNYDTCEDFFQRDAENKNNHCQCFVLTNLTENLHGEIVAHCQLEIYNRQDSNIDNTSVKIITDDIISNASGQCDPYKTEKTTANEICETIPDSIFNDEFQLYTLNVLTQQSDKYVANVNKSLRWSLDGNNSTIGLRNKITVRMNSEWLQNGHEANDTKGLSARQYLLYLYRFYRNDNIMRRYLIFSTTREVVHVTYRSTVIDVIALALGLVLLTASIALFALRNRILGIESTVVTTIEPTANNRHSRNQPEERPLAASVNNEYL